MALGKEVQEIVGSVDSRAVDQAPIAAPLAVCCSRLACRSKSDQAENLQGQIQAEAGVNVDIDADCISSTVCITIDADRWSCIPGNHHISVL